MDLREIIIEAIKKEVVGPDPHPAYTDPQTSEEILLDGVHGSPKRRYGAGMLYPRGTNFESTLKNEDSENFDDSGNREEEEIFSGDAAVSGEGSGNTPDDTESEEPVGLANQLLPSAMGFTIRVKNTEAKIRVKIHTAWYDRGDGELPVKTVTESGEIEVKAPEKAFFMRQYWIRRPLPPEEGMEDIPLNKLCKRKGKVHEKTILHLPDRKPWLTLEVRNRTTPLDRQNNCCTLTFSLVNCAGASPDHRISDQYILFQNQLEVFCTEPGIIQPYREKLSRTDTDEEKEMRLLYRKKRVFAIGHGCSVRWEQEEDGVVRKICTEFTPEFEIPPVNPTGHVELSMLELSDRGDWEKAKTRLQELTDKYGAWIDKLAVEAKGLEDIYREPALKNIEKCRSNLERIRKGVSILAGEKTNSLVVRAFRWMNRAMIWQQQRSKTPQRKWIRVGKGNRGFIPATLPDGSERHSTLEEFHETGWGRWRPFQLAFILMNIEGSISPDSPEREIVDLIWFPTGGGKTEAYLGLAAFTILYQRLKEEEDNVNPEYGTTVLMRYTLRLLTTQQYERASSLICACDLIRQEKGNELYLGRTPTSIGLWVGGQTTPNNNDEAVEQFRRLELGNNTEYNFIVMKCPCCGVQIGPIDNPTRNVRIKGLKKNDADQRIYFSCENENCEYYSRELPLYVVDPDIYQKSPTLVLGTVDKFAMLTWKEQSGSLFGFRKDSRGDYYRISPPALIIQDELHLISGPLGTIVGLYETLVQTLCTDYGRNKPPFYPSDGGRFYPPKIVASSATISRAGEQVRALYRSDNLNIFPPQGLAFGDTWFSEEQKDKPGRKYLGILAPGYQSGQTTVVRVYSALMQAVSDSAFPDAQKDFYWTLLGFFNSIRELGMASSLINADIADYLKVLHNRKLIPADRRRYVRNQIELTSRISSGKIPEYLKILEAKFTGEKSNAADICLATNMIATGVDISRLALMVIHGQPKTTAEYIQASSRVGRDKDGPGLVITLYSPSKPRDKSQYEQFQGYHSRIYSSVEPTSVTPFSVNAAQRALHAVVIGVIRHFSENKLRVHPDFSGNRKEFDQLKGWAKKLILNQCRFIDPGELEEVEKLFDQRIEFMERGFNSYGDASNKGILGSSQSIPMMYGLGGNVPRELKLRSLPTPTSMRGVDQESNIDVFYS
ncbi:MAG: hypothetical protein KDD02_07850 [Phaeodactylibacter sp.]|nr:hypothetical protein [Phaeodactylibacter sp.]MCB9302638.1 hypothetical protein [Lewinellaceae bacterium]